MQKVYIFSNVAYEKEKRLCVDRDDLLVFLNKAASISYYEGHPNRAVYHRFPEESYGTFRADVPNFYVWGNHGRNQIDPAFIRDLRSKYDWNYPIEAGKRKDPTTGYIVTKYMEKLHPDKEIVLVNFGYSITSTLLFGF